MTYSWSICVSRNFKVFFFVVYLYVKFKIALDVNLVPEVGSFLTHPPNPLLACRHFWSKLIRIFVLLHSGRKGKPRKNKNKPSEPSGGLKNQGEECELISGSSSFPWGRCALPVSCPGGTKLNCAEGLRCCKTWAPHRWYKRISLKIPKQGD